jgi:hypothetical protein
LNRYYFLPVDGLSIFSGGPSFFALRPAFRLIQASAAKAVRSKTMTIILSMLIAFSTHFCVRDSFAGPQNPLNRQAPSLISEDYEMAEGDYADLRDIYLKKRWHLSCLMSTSRPILQ